MKIPEIQENERFELNLTKDQKQLLIDFSYQEAQKWYDVIVLYGTKDTFPQIDMIRYLDLYYHYSKIFNELTNRDFIEDYRLHDILCIK